MSKMAEPEQETEKPLVMVRWLDSAQLDGGDWVTIERVTEALNDGFAQCSIGFLVAENDEALVIARSVSEWKESAEKLEGVLAIPKAAITERFTCSVTQMTQFKK